MQRENVFKQKMKQQHQSSESRQDQRHILFDGIQRDKMRCGGKNFKSSCYTRKQQVRAQINKTKQINKQTRC